MRPIPKQRNRQPCSAAAMARRPVLRGRREAGIASRCKWRRRHVRLPALAVPPSLPVRTDVLVRVDSRHRRLLSVDLPPGLRTTGQLDENFGGSALSWLLIALRRSPRTTGAARPARRRRREHPRRINRRSGPEAANRAARGGPQVADTYATRPVRSSGPE